MTVGTSARRPPTLGDLAAGAVDALLAGTLLASRS